MGEDIKPCAAVSEDLVEEESNSKRKYDIEEVHIQRRKMARRGAAEIDASGSEDPGLTRLEEGVGLLGKISRSS